MTDKYQLEDLIIKATIEQVLTDECIVKVAREIVKFNKENDNTQNWLDMHERDLKEVQKEINNYLTAIGQGLFTPDMKERMLILDNRKNELNELILKENWKKPQLVDEDKIIFYLKQFRQGKENDEKFKYRLINTFIDKIILFNNKAIITYNIKDSHGEQLSITEIIKSFECSTNQRLVSHW